MNLDSSNKDFIKDIPEVKESQEDNIGFTIIDGALTSKQKKKLEYEKKKRKWDKYDAENMFNRVAKDFEVNRYIHDKIEEATSCEGDKAEQLFAAVEAVQDCKNMPHIDIVNKRMTIIKSMYGAMDIKEPWAKQYANYYAGYAKGLVDLMNINREVFKSKPGVVYGIYYKISEESVLKYKEVLRCYRGMQNIDSSELESDTPKNKYIISNDLDRVASYLRPYEYDVETNTIYVSMIIYDKGSEPTVEELQRVSLGGNGNTFLIKDDEYSMVSLKDTLIQIITCCVID